MKKVSIASLTKQELHNKPVFVRVDFNVPIKNGTVTDDTRIKAALPTINYLRENGAIVILASHLGKPKGKVVEEYRMDPVKVALEKLINVEVIKLNDCIGEQVKQTISNATAGQVILLENLRFHPGEEKNDPEFSKQLASLAQIYVNDAFGTAHRAHASTVGITNYLPAYCGFLMQKEIEMLSKTLFTPSSPFVAIIGGAKVSTKIGVLKNLLDKVDTMIIGGGMTFTFLGSMGVPVGKSLVEPDMFSTAKEVLEEAKKRNKNVVLPLDTVLAEGPDSNSISGIALLTDKVTPSSDTLTSIPDNLMGVDIGPLTIQNIKEILKDAKTVLWNGPLGICENSLFAKGTEEVAKLVGEIVKRGGISVVGGGDSVAAIEKLGLKDNFSHISTGGGASLEFLEGIELPGIKVLKDAN